MTDFFHQVGIQLQALNLLEIVAVIAGFLYVILASKGNKLCFIFGLISSLIYVYITIKYKLYFDAGINIYYIIMSFVGWYEWSKKSADTNLKVEESSTHKLYSGLITSAAVCLLLAFLADYFTDAELTYVDSFTTIFAIYATILTVKRKIENWLIWIVVDLVATAMYFYKELYFTSILFLFYTLIAIFGYLEWKKLLTEQKR